MPPEGEDFVADCNNVETLVALNETVRSLSRAYRVQSCKFDAQAFHRGEKKLAELWLATVKAIGEALLRGE